MNVRDPGEHRDVEGLAQVRAGARREPTAPKSFASNAESANKRPIASLVNPRSIASQSATSAENRHAALRVLARASRAGWSTPHRERISE